MRRLNILNKQGFLTDIDRKEKFEHHGGWLNFETNLELSVPIRITMLGGLDKISIENYSRDLSLFMNYWYNFVLCDLNGFNGFNNIKFELVGFKII